MKFFPKLFSRSLRPFYYYGLIEILIYFFSWAYSKLFFHPSAHVLLPYTIRNRRSIFIKGKLFAKSNLYLEPFEGSVVVLGANIFFNRGCYITAISSIHIGNDCLFGPNVFISDHDHGHYSSPLVADNFLSPPLLRDICSVPVNIGNCVWVGANVCILKGVNVGDNCVIGANSVVTRDLPPNSICAGVPCIVIRTLDPSLC